MGNLRRNTMLRNYFKVLLFQASACNDIKKRKVLNFNLEIAVLLNVMTSSHNISV